MGPRAAAHWIANVQALTIHTCLKPSQCLLSGFIAPYSHGLGTCLSRQPSQKHAQQRAYCVGSQACES